MVEIVHLSSEILGTFQTVFIDPYARTDIFEAIWWICAIINDQFKTVSK